MNHSKRPSRAWTATLTLLVASGLAVGVAAPPAGAVTNQFRGVNWPDTRDNYNTGWVIPDGLAASDSYATVHSIADTYIKAFQRDLSANTVRLPINEPSVSQAWWGSYRGAVDAALSDNMKVILSYWAEKKSVGTITNMSAWTTMWNTVVSDYGSNPNVYFEPMNEPYDYTLSRWVSICSGWLAAHPSIPRDRVIISGTGYNAYVTGVGAASALKGTFLSLHVYPGWTTDTQESQWQSFLKGRLGTYADRTIIDEFGAPMTTGINYLTGHNSTLDQSYLAAVTDLARSDSMGSVYWAGLKTGDNFSMEAHHGNGLAETNSSGAEQVRWGYGI